VLRACRRVLRPGGLIAFTSIFVAPGLPERARRRAARAGPPGVSTSSDYPRLLRSAGFIEVDQLDLTPTYLDTVRAWVRHAEQFEAELGRSALPLAFAEKLDRRRAARAAIEAGLLRRALYLARRWVRVRPGRGDR